MLTRRRFLQATGACALVVGLAPGGGLRAGAAGTPALARLSHYVAVHADGHVEIVVPVAEIGQGVYDALPRLVAEELDADWARVEVVQPTADAAFTSPLSKRQRVANSESVMGYYEPLRRVGATCRALLVHAAAAEWGVAPESCTTARGRVVHADGRSLGYGELAAAAAALPVPADVPLKDPARFQLIGQRLPRKDAQPKSDGSALFAIDLRLPGMLTAVLRRPPTLGGSVRRFDAASVRDLPGVVAVAECGDSVAVLADHFWNARRAAEQLEVEFDPGPLAGWSTEGMRAELAAALDRDAEALPFPNVDTQQKPPKLTPFDRAAALAAFEAAPRRLELEYEVPHLAHLCMEPMTAVAQVGDGECRIWAGHQQPDRARETAAQLLGIAPERVRFDIVLGGGGFGRRWELDYVRYAVLAAKAVPGRPVKLVYTREQDTQHDYYRPAYRVRTRVGLDEGGIVAMVSRISGQSIWRYQGRAGIPGSADPTKAALLVYDVYDFPGKAIDAVDTPWEQLPVGLWRSVTLSQNAFFAESAIDEAARALGEDPYRFRRRLLARHPRLVRVLDAAAEAAGWDRPLPKGRGRGIALAHGFESVCVQVIEAEVAGAEFRVHRIVCAIDCGRAVSPLGVEAQMQSGIVFGLSAALRGDLDIEGGAVQDGNFGTQAILRFGETPRIDVVIVPSEHTLGGVGEAAVPPVAPALANAIHAAGGPRLRRLPLSGDDFRFVS